MKAWWRIDLPDWMRPDGVLSGILLGLFCSGVGMATPSGIDTRFQLRLAKKSHIFTNYLRQT
jgi:hypothetical protein